jgi:two-component system chemotaxis response regulator CheB
VSAKRVLIVDDAAVVRRILSRAVEADGRFRVAGVAADPEAALRKAKVLRPEAVILDVDLAGADGLKALVELRRELPEARIIMFSALTGPGAEATVEALLLGANSYAPKPDLLGSVDEAEDYVREHLLDRLADLFPPAVPLPAAPAPRQAPPSGRKLAQRPQLLLVAASTGGPVAFTQFLKALGAGFPLPVLLVQHMPVGFIEPYARRLQQEGPLRVRPAVDAGALEPGVVLIAPGERHLRLRRGAHGLETWISDEAPLGFCKPAATHTFKDAAALVGAAALAVVLTGMGQDGLEGCRDLHEAGARIWAQDEASSVVWGMPGAVNAAGLCEALLPPAALGAELRRVVEETLLTVPA